MTVQPVGPSSYSATPISRPGKSNIRDTALLAIEGERDDISGIGQTKAALNLAASLPKSTKQYHLAKGVGHYGIFNGSKWRERIAPVVEDWIAQHNG